jgi:hypothetical protein
MAQNKAYGMPINDSATGVHAKETGDAKCGLSSLEKFRPEEYPVTEQARFSAGQRNEDVGGGFKLVQ